MASQTLRQRPKDGPTITTTTANPTNNRRAKKLAMAKKGLRSLAFTIVIPFILTAFAAYLSGCSAAVATKPFWHPPVWAFHLASISSACLMGLSAWLVWEEGGFHRQTTALPLYSAQFSLSLLWGPLVFGVGATRAGLVVCVVLFAVLFGCAQCFRMVNPIAGDLVKPCLAWASFLAVFNYKLL